MHLKLVGSHGNDSHIYLNRISTHVLMFAMRHISYSRGIFLARQTRTVISTNVFCELILCRLLAVPRWMWYRDMMRCIYFVMLKSLLGGCRPLLALTLTICGCKSPRLFWSNTWCRNSAHGCGFMVTSVTIVWDLRISKIWYVLLVCLTTVYLR